MDVRSIISMFGYSEESPEMKAIFKQLQILSKPELEIGDRIYKNKKMGIELNCLSRYNFESRYGEPRKIFTQSPEESFLQSVSLGNYNQNSVFNQALPVELLYKDNPGTVLKKLGVKAKEAGETTYGEYMEFKINELDWVIGFNKKRELICVHIWLMTKQERLLIEMKRLLKGQDKLITTDNQSELETMRNKLPTLKWHKRMQQGDTLFTEQNIAEVATALVAFIDDLLLCTAKKKAAPVYASVKRLVIHINKLNSRFDGFIETMEREELVPFIQQAVHYTGFQTEKNFDITEAVRMW